ncbi:MAG: hypothetical protein ACLP50_04645 [Solirubrobacteraceae bacterium]
MQKLAFRFDQEAVILDGWAHRQSCPRLPAPIPERAQLVPAGGVVLRERCPRECPCCAPGFLTLLGHQAAGDRVESAL